LRSSIRSTKQDSSKTASRISKPSLLTPSTKSTPAKQATRRISTPASPSIIRTSPIEVLQPTPRFLTIRVVDDDQPIEEKQQLFQKFSVWLRRWLLGTFLAYEFWDYTKHDLPAAPEDVIPALSQELPALLRQYLTASSAPQLFLSPFVFAEAGPQEDELTHYFIIFPSPHQQNKQLQQQIRQQQLLQQKQHQLQQQQHQQKPTERGQGGPGHPRDQRQRPTTQPLAHRILVLQVISKKNAKRHIEDQPESGQPSSSPSEVRTPTTTPTMTPSTPPLLPHGIVQVSVSVHEAGLLFELFWKGVMKGLGVAPAARLHGIPGFCKDLCIGKRIGFTLQKKNPDYAGKPKPDLMRKKKDSGGGMF